MKPINSLTAGGQQLVGEWDTFWALPTIYPTLKLASFMVLSILSLEDFWYSFLCFPTSTPVAFLRLQTLPHCPSPSLLPSGVAQLCTQPRLVMNTSCPHTCLSFLTLETPSTPVMQTSNHGWWIFCFLHPDCTETHWRKPHNLAGWLWDAPPAEPHLRQVDHFPFSKLYFIV